MSTGTAEPIFNWIWRGGGKKGRGGLDKKRQGREFVGGSGAILPQKSLKSTGPEISGVFNNLREAICRKDSDRFYIFKIVVLLHSSSSFNVFFILHACLILKKRFNYRPQMHTSKRRIYIVVYISFSKLWPVPGIQLVATNGRQSDWRKKLLSKTSTGHIPSPVREGKARTIKS